MTCFYEICLYYYLKNGSISNFNIRAPNLKLNIILQSLNRKITNKILYCFLISNVFIRIIPFGQQKKINNNLVLEIINFVLEI